MLHILIRLIFTRNTLLAIKLNQKDVVVKVISTNLFNCSPKIMNIPDCNHALEKKKMALNVSSVNLYPLENAKAHNTHKFEAVHLSPPTAIFRRGQEFDLDIVFSNRSFNSQLDKLRIFFNYEDEKKKPQAPRGAAWLVDNQDLTDDPYIWSLRTIKNEGKTLKLKMKIPVICAVGAWTIKIKIDLRSRLGGTTYEHPDLVYILFNPWNKNDTVYMPETHLLEEYVMNDVGKVYVGNQVSSVGRQWLFGQFEAHVLPICRKVLEPTWEELSYNKRCDPIYLSRACSGVGKILSGNWSGNYEGGTNPSLWTGSAPILKEYSVTGTPVKYGQCWVFASLGCSVCRALGIPARVVTNIISAQDYDESLTIDKYFDATGELIRGESLWNFHAWIDVWLARPDLPLGYGGWQAVDPTMHTGPSSLEAIKRGEVGYAFDVPEKISEVNADLVDWKVDEEALLGYKKIKTVTDYVGYQMLTKRPHIFDPNGERDRDDVMYQYKNPEGTKEERLALLRAAMHCSERSCEVFELEDAKQLEEIKFSISKIEKIYVGKSFTIILDIENTVAEKRKVQLVFTLFSLYYNGNKAHTIKKIVQTIELSPNEKKQFQANISAEDYVDKLVEFSLLKLYVIATVDETKQTWVQEEDYQVIKPTLTIQAIGSLSVGKPGKIVFQLKNPLKKKLTECVLAFDGPGILKYQKNSFRDVLPEENFKIEATVTPSTSGKLTLVAIFYSKELQDIMGSALIDVTS